MALSLSRLDINISLYDINPLSNIINRSRTYALTHSTKNLLKELDLWDKFQPHLVSFTSLIIQDTVTNRKATLNLLDLSLDNRVDNSIGWIIEHRILMQLLVNELINSDNINFICKQNFLRNIL